MPVLELLINEEATSGGALFQLPTPGDRNPQFRTRILRNTHTHTETDTQAPPFWERTY